MKTRMSFVILMLLVLPMLLSACGGSKTGNAEKFLTAVGEGDFDEAKKYVCDKEKDKVEGDANFPEGAKLKDIKCEEDGDDVKCTFKLSLEGVAEQETSLTFTMDGSKVCGIVVQ